MNNSVITATKTLVIEKAKYYVLASLLLARMPCDHIYLSSAAPAR